ncbi:AAA-ATPase [Zea mays]|uniref:AAA-ATPase n=2 Tax=Zea mays TaxID=4577 RepID=A0A3L6EUA0_MAIZE|nr:AAA-ATPase [Zea mays]
MEEGDEMLDVYQGTEFKWCLVCKDNSKDSLNNGGQNESQLFELAFNKRHKDKALKSYLPFILATAKSIKAQERTLMIYMTEFIKRNDYYKKIGKAWKRGYLLYGPPGTGKSSLIAAMANHLREEGEGHGKSKSTEQNRREEKVTLSGLLNFVDGLWSTSGEERIIVFTTNYKEWLDPALLRPGRMDMHIHMGYCTLESFQILANNYHSIEYHDTYPKIEKLIKEMMVTPAEVAEVLMRNDDTDVVLHDLIGFLKSRMKDVNEVKSEHKKVNNKMDEKKEDKDNDKD